jgi:hypothetical protein
VRYLSLNIHVVCEALEIYLRESNENLFGQLAFESFLISSGSGKETTEAQKVAALTGCLGIMCFLCLFFTITFDSVAEGFVSSTH